MVDLPHEIEVRWGGTKGELLLLEKWESSDRTFTLYVKNQDLHDKTCSSVGGILSIPLETVEQGKKTLASKKEQSWRGMIGDMSQVKANTILTRIVSNAIQNGKKPRACVSIIHDCLHNGVNPLDADVLLRLRSER